VAETKRKEKKKVDAVTVDEKSVEGDDVGGVVGGEREGGRRRGKSPWSGGPSLRNASQLGAGCSWLELRGSLFFYSSHTALLRYCHDAPSFTMYVEDCSAETQAGLLEESSACGDHYHGLVDSRLSASINATAKLAHEILSTRHHSHEKARGTIATAKVPLDRRGKKQSSHALVVTVATGGGSMERRSPCRCGPV